MAIARTDQVGLTYPGLYGDRNWHVPITKLIEILDGLGPVGGLCVSAGAIGAAPDLDPTGLNVRVAAGTFLDATGCPVAYAGNPTYAVPDTATTRVWLTADGTLASGAAWPSTAHVRLATVVAGATDITSITDERIALRPTGGGALALAADATVGAGTSLVTIDATAGDVTATLPPVADCPGMVIRAKRLDASGNVATVAADGAETIEGAADYDLAAQWSGVTLVSDWTRWLAFGS